MSRIYELLGEDYQVTPFRDLPTSHQLAIAFYMSVDGCAWELLIDDEIANIPFELEKALPEYVRRYGDIAWNVACLPVERVIAAVLADEGLADSFKSWDEYATWYARATELPNHSKENRWPVILSEDDYETIRDGWHRFHSYVRAGCTHVPVVL